VTTSQQIPITITVNGERKDLLAEPLTSLLDILRFKLDLRGAHRGCDTGHCGNCTVLLKRPAVHDSHIPVVSCLVLAVEADGCQILTVESLAQDGRLHPVQQSFIHYGGLQCGYCTSGMLMSAVALYEENPQPTETEARQAISGNLCRCTGYAKIVQAMVQAHAFSGDSNR